MVLYERLATPILLTQGFSSMGNWNIGLTNFYLYFYKYYIINVKYVV